MDMDDDFIGEIEFNLSPEQAELGQSCDQRCVQDA